METATSSWTMRLLVLLAIEKVVQHAFVSFALLAGRFGLRQAVVVDYRWLGALGLLAMILFALACWGLLRGQRWSLTLLVALALFDIAGEFIAQGKVSITITVSLLVALAILFLASRLTRQPRPA